MSASFGPRIGRAHVSSRGVGVSSGLGPFSVYSGTGGGSRRRPRSQYTDYERAYARAEREEAIEDALARDQALAALLVAHKVEFPLAQRPVAAPPTITDAAAISASLRREKFAEIPWYRRSERGGDAAEASKEAEAKAEDETERKQAEAAAEQATLDEEWRLLLENDAATVLQSVEAAFADNMTPAAPVNCEDNELSVVIRVASLERLIPTHSYELTPTGRPTIRKRTKTNRNHLYLGLIASQALVTVKEALAVALCIQSVAFLVIRDDEDEGYLTPLYCGRVTRAWADQVDWANAIAVEALASIEDSRWQWRGRTDEVTPLDLSDEPEIAALVEDIAAGMDKSVDPYCYPPRSDKSGPQHGVRPVCPIRRLVHQREPRMVMRH